MNDEYDLEAMKKEVEKNEKEKIQAKFSEEDIISKLEKNLDQYNIAMEYFQINEDIEELISAIDDSFDINLAIFEARFGGSTDEINRYITRRDEIIKPYIEKKIKTI